MKCFGPNRIGYDRVSTVKDLSLILSLTSAFHTIEVHSYSSLRGQIVQIRQLSMQSGFFVQFSACCTGMVQILFETRCLLHAKP